VVHRDLKPSNILVVDPELSLRPCVKIADFGICKISEPAASTDTATGMLLGTPSYMAPEQIVFEPVTAKTDVYALGEILYEMLVGERLFGRDVDDIFRRKLERDPIEVSLPPELPARDELRALIRRCIAYRPEDRPTAREVAEAVASIASHGRPRRSKRRIAFGVVSAGFIAGLIATLLILPLFTSRPPIVARSIVEAPAIAAPAIPETPAIEETPPQIEPELDLPARTDKPAPKKSLPFKRKELPQW
jgi:serine/threonine protein kinase